MINDMTAFCMQILTNVSTAQHTTALKLIMRTVEIWKALMYVTAAPVLSDKAMSVKVDNNILALEAVNGIIIS